MKILAISDVESKYLWDYFQPEKLEGVDLILSCGDLKASYLTLLATFTHAPLLYVHGNHDTDYQRRPPEGCTCIEDTVYEVNGVRIAGLDTFVAFTSGLIIFPACFAFDVDAGSGPGLVFVTLPNVFNSMPGGQLWGMLFFVFMSFAALTTIIAVLENIVAYGIDVLKWTRKKAVTVNFVLVFLLSLPCALGFNVLSGIQPFGPGSMILDLEDFIVSNNLLPLGSMVFLFFCCYKRGWGWDNFIAEADTGKGLMFPKGLRLYVKYVLPFIVFFVFVQGYIDKFFK